MPKALSRTELLPHARFYLRAKRLFPVKSNTRRHTDPNGLAGTGLIDETPVISSNIFSDVRCDISGHEFWLMYSGNGTQLCLNFVKTEPGLPIRKILQLHHTTFCPTISERVLVWKPAVWRIADDFRLRTFFHALLAISSNP